MPLSWNEIRTRALQFSKEWAQEHSEDAEAKSFWDDFFNVFGISRRRVAAFEKAVKKQDGKQGYIDLLWKGVMLVEHKSRGKDLDRAYTQAKDYFAGLKEHELPRYVLVSDFQRFRLYDLDKGEEHSFWLEELVQHIHLFGFIAGYEQRQYKEQDPVNIEAAERMGALHDALEASGYTGHALEAYLVRLLFCLFADDTGIFERTQFQDFIDTHTKLDGSDLAGQLAQFFQTLNTPKDKRMRTLDETINAFPYINGKLFEEFLPLAAFDSRMREMLLQACAVNWSQISPAIFGSMFQAVMNPKERRNLGAHYTSEQNIHKLIEPLFLEDLRRDLERAGGNKARLQELQKRMAKLRFLDPACGCGNFLIVAYRELRLLELELLKKLYPERQGFLDISQLAQVEVDQFAGIEYDEFPARIAEVAMWLADHQQNLLLSQEFGQYFARLPLRKAARIAHANALHTDWRSLFNGELPDYILGNPPFVGKHLQGEEQKNDMLHLFGDISGLGVLDYVSAWYIKAAQLIEHTPTKAAFVSTNSIVQGEQVSILWGLMLNKYNMRIRFAHRTFKWKNEARGNAAVYCVIVGFEHSSNAQNSESLRIYDYERPDAEPQALSARYINAYLVDAPNVIISKRQKPLCGVSEIIYGNKIVDGGFYLFTDSEKDDFLQKEPKAAEYFRPILSGDEFLNGKNRWVLYLADIEPQEIKKMPLVADRIKKVAEYRASSSKGSTQKAALTPTLFTEQRQPKTNFLLIPRTTSENRRYIPFGFFPPSYVVNDSCLALPNADLYLFGHLMSTMHMAWVKSVCGRLESRFRYSNTIVYNNYPFPREVSAALRERVEKAAAGVLAAREAHKGSSLADLYDALTMPPDLQKAHAALDKAVDASYRAQAFASEAARMEWLFNLYQEYSAPMFGAEKKKKGGKKQKED